MPWFAFGFIGVATVNSVRSIPITRAWTRVTTLLQMWRLAPGLRRLCAMLSMAATTLALLTGGGERSSSVY